MTKPFNKGERMNKTVAEIITEYLSENGYDGLFNDSVPCGCVLGDIAPCSIDCGFPVECMAAYKYECDQKADCDECESQGEKAGFCMRKAPHD